MSGKLPLVLVASLALVSVAAAHSVEKRQTTVSKSATTRNSLNNPPALISQLVFKHQEEIMTFVWVFDVQPKFADSNYNFPQFLSLIASPRHFVRSKK